MGGESPDEEGRRLAERRFLLGLLGNSPGCDIPRCRVCARLGFGPPAQLPRAVLAGPWRQPSRWRRLARWLRWRFTGRWAR